MFSFFRPKSPKGDYIKVLQSLKHVVEGVVPAGWGDAAQICKALEASETALDTDLNGISQCEGVFPTKDSAGPDTVSIVEYLRSWHVLGNSPSLVAMAVAACEEFGIKKPDNVQLLLLAAVLGDVENDLPYHNNLHFKKVMLQLMRLISVHNSIYGGTAKALDEDQCAVLLIGGCIHDLGHDGLGNTVKGVFYSGRLERQSFDFAKPYLEAAGAGREMLDPLRAMILTTDVTPLGDVTNPMNQMKAAFRYHFRGEKEKFPSLNLSDELEVFEDDAALTVMACMLHEADIATSAGLEYSITQFETCKLMEEIGSDDARPSHVLDFLDKVCQRRFLSDAGQELFGANLARIVALSEEADQAGNEAFPKADHTSFILASSVARNTSKTLN